MTTIIDRTMPIVAFGIMLTSIPAHAVILPVPGNYIDQTGACMSVTARNTAERTFTLSSGDVCKPGVTVLEGSESEEKTFRCVAQLNEGALAGYLGAAAERQFLYPGRLTIHHG